MEAINPANVSLPMSRNNSSSSTSSAASNLSGSTKATSASEASAKAKAAKKAPQTDTILNDSRFLRTSMTTVKKAPVNGEQVLSDTAELRTAIATPVKSKLVSAAKGVINGLINGVKYLGSLIGAAVGAVKNFLSNLFTSKAAKAEAAVYAAELLPDFTEQDFKETFSLYATGATKRDLAAGKLSDVEGDAKPISLSAKQFDGLKSFKVVGAPKAGNAAAVFVEDHAAKVAMFKELDEQAEMAAWHQS